MPFTKITQIRTEKENGRLLIISFSLIILSKTKGYFNQNSLHVLPHRDASLRSVALPGHKYLALIRPSIDFSKIMRVEFQQTVKQEKKRGKT